MYIPQSNTHFEDDFSKNVVEKCHYGKEAIFKVIRPDSIHYPQQTHSLGDKKLDLETVLCAIFNDFSSQIEIIQIPDHIFFRNS